MVNRLSSEFFFFFYLGYGCGNTGDKYKEKTTKNEIIENISYRLRTNAQQDQRQETAEQKVDNQQRLLQK